MFKENLREILDYQDVTIKELSYRTGISKRSIENYLGARACIPPADYACKIAAALNTTVEALVDGTSVNGAEPAAPPRLSPQSIDLIRKYEKLPAHEQKAVRSLVETLLKA